MDQSRKMDERSDIDAPNPSHSPSSRIDTPTKKPRSSARKTLQRLYPASKLTVPLGKDLIGRIRAADLTQMPHLLIAGSTGTGKSVFINSLLMGMLYKATPDEMKLVLIDPKRLESGCTRIFRTCSRRS